MECVIIFLNLYHASGKRKSFQSKRDEEDELELPLFDILTIRTATNDFSNENIIGEGGFGPVYKVI